MRILISILFPFLIIPLTDGSKKCVIRPNKGINEIVLDSSKLKDVQNVYAQIELERKWIKAVETEVFGKYERFINVPTVAKFSSFSRNNKISKIEIDSDCNCTTPEGIGIGSHYNQTLKVFGKPKLQYNIQCNGLQQIKLIYENMDVLFNGKDTLNSTICKIIIW